MENLRANVLGVGIHAVDMPRAVARVLRALEDREKGYVCLTGVHGIMEARRDPTFRAILNGALLNAPDGMPTVWKGWADGHRAMDRVYGPDFMLETMRATVPRGDRHYLYGGAPGVAEALRECLARKVPGVTIVGTFTPPFRPLDAQEEAALADDVRATKPDVIWVGISTPKQERFAAEHVAKLDATLIIAVGAAFDLHTGRSVDAPAWMKRAGLQWAHRLAQDPRRLARRYLANNPRFIAEIALQLARVRAYPID